MARSVIISIRPFFVNAIFCRKKRFEFRRVVARFRTGDQMLVYATAPLSLLVGEFRVGRVLTGTPEEVCALTAPDPLRQYTSSYLRGAKSCTAIEILDPTRWASPVPLGRLFPGKRPPQSYALLKEHNGLFRDH